MKSFKNFVIEDIGVTYGLINPNQAKDAIEWDGKPSTIQKIKRFIYKYIGTMDFDIKKSKNTIIEILLNNEKLKVRKKDVIVFYYGHLKIFKYEG